MQQWFDAIILGIVQGVTEFIPVSSSGHLVLVQNLLTGTPSHLFIQFLDIGTTLALLVFFRMRIWGILVDVFKNKNYRLARNLIITVFPAAIIGFMLAGFIESNSFFVSPVVVATGLGIVGIIMVILEKLPKTSAVDTGEELPWWRALVIGVAQVFALIPGVSRSGTTIIAGRLMGLNPQHSAEYSFLVSIPIMLGVTLKLVLSDHEYFVQNFGMVVIANAAAFIAGVFVIKFLMDYLSKHSLALFGWYRIALALVVFTVILLQ
ncbi:MAG: undecaprenyl-diphosphate phosphatase [Candidatus Saccharimonadaceae bacterium]